MTRRLRAVWRLTRSLVHGLHGFAIVLVRFRSLAAEQKHELIGWWSTKMLRLMGIALQVQGSVHAGGTLLVANHISWLDINVVHAVAPHARFVSKSDVKSWPLLSQLADAASTLYLERDRKRDALRVVRAVAQALQAGETVAVFPEGTTSDGKGLRPFHANLLQAAVSTAAPVQPVAIRFSDAVQPISAAVEFVGNTTLVRSLWNVACAQDLVAHVTLLPARPSAELDRRALAQTLRADIGATIPA
jgi:1-acyl-sn-glycerol-3-phosphate acyltransferase